MKIYIQNHETAAGHYIYKGYAHAWIYEGYPVQLINSLDEVNEQEYMLMVTDGFIKNEKHLETINKSKKCFLYVAPNNFPDPWGQHPNWKCQLSNSFIKNLNSMQNVIQWTFCDVNDEIYNLWRKVNTVPLAFDDISYAVANPAKKDHKYDVCFIGGIADNGFNEKLPIMREILDHLVSSGLRCGFSVEQNISHELENETIANSKIAINIHDKYQRVLGYDCNERTFKSLGINGFLVSDKVTQLSKIFPDVPTTNDKEKFLQYCLDFSKKDLFESKASNIENILVNHTYKSRVQQLLEI